MILFYEEERQNRARVYSQVNDVDSLTPEQRESGLLVENIPNDESKVGEYGVYFLNPTTKEVWIEYAPRPLSPEEEIEQLKEELTLARAAIDDIIMGGMM